MMDVKRLAIPEVMVLKPRPFPDDRGFFVETYNAARMAQLAGIDTVFVQDNMSLSHPVGTVRGLHFQRPPSAQAKLVSVARGRIFDVAVDARKGSPTYGRHVFAEISAAEGNQIFVPRGFLHGFMTLEPDTLVTYKVDAYYDQAADGAVRWNDPALGIDWPLSGEVSLSKKDLAAPLFADADLGFDYSPGAAA